MARIFDAQANVQVEIPFSLIDLDSVLVSGEAGNVVTELYDEDGTASESVVIAEKESTGVYEARVSFTKSKATGHIYLLRIISPPNITDEAILPFHIQVYPTLAVSSVVGAFLTTLANVKEIRSITVTDHDAVLTSLIARISKMIESRLGDIFQQLAYTEFHNGSGTVLLRPFHRPIVSVSSIHISKDQKWDSTTLVDATGYVIDLVAGLIYRKDGGGFGQGFQNVRVVYTSGYAAVPLDVEHYAIEKILVFFDQREQLGLTSVSLKDGSFTKQASVKDSMSDIATRLGKYRLRRAA